MERFFLNLKMERYGAETTPTRKKPARDVADYLLTFYNQKRLKRWAYMSPPEFERYASSNLRLCRHLADSIGCSETDQAFTANRLDGRGFLNRLHGGKTAG